MTFFAHGPMLLSLLTVALAIAPAAAAEKPYDAMARSFGVYLDPADPLAWPAKVHAIARDESHYWRGTRDLFYAWCVPNCADWLADRDAYAVSQGDPHWGNLGTYAAAGDFGAVAAGPVDFDESARLPFQLELLQGVITFDLIARQNALRLTDDQRTALHAAIFDTYADTLAGPVTDAVVDDALRPWLKSRGDRAYSVDLDKFTRAGRFRTAVTKKGVVTDWLRPSRFGRAEVATALADAVRHDARLAALLRPYDAAEFEASILDVADRVRVDSSGSQGLVKLLVLLRRPFRGPGVDRDVDRGVDRGVDGAFDGILTLKQQVPAAAERAGLVPPDPRPPGVRYVRDLDVLTHGRALAASWCDLGGRSFWVSVKEPWSEEPDAKDLTSDDALLAATRAWAVVFADSHRDDAVRLRGRLTAAVRVAVDRRAAAYLADEAASYAAFAADPRTRDAIARFDAAVPRP